MNETLKNLSKKEMQNDFRIYLQQNNYAKNSIGTFSSQALFLFDKLGADEFWEIIESNDFDNIARQSIYNELVKTGTQKYTSSYLSNLRCFRKFCGIVTDYNEKEKLGQRNQSSIKMKVQNAKPTLIIFDAIEAIKKYHYSINNDYTRYRSWEHCYNYFKLNRKDTTKTDLLCLHLAWYLASWGMLRGSAGLINYDYLVHKDFVTKISEEKYDSLYDFSLNEDLIFDAVQLINECYPESISKTDTLITKILLGVFGCVPAYDRYFKSALSHYNIGSKSFSRNSLQDIWSYYCQNINEFENLRKELATEGFCYTPMKLIDMCFWQIGFDDEQNNK